MSLHSLLRLLFACLASASALAHPVTQGAIAVDVQRAHIDVRARVAAEEVIVANAFAPPQAQAADTAGMLAAHGRYLAARLRVYLDGVRLPLRLLSAPTALPAGDALVEYRLVANLPERAQQVGALLRIEQDLLNEFEFAPGNPWEATFLVRTSLAGRPLAGERLLTRRDAVQFDVRAATAAGAGASSVAADAAGMPDRALFAAYLHAGAMHILGGWDHLLFVAALVLATATLWDLVKVVTAFTLAHSLTLALSVLDVVRLPSSIVEPVIAGSIVAMAAWNLLWPRHANGSARLMLAFGFGLFHGLGFAGGLLETMQAAGSLGIALAIVAFTLGVELGHQVVVLPAFAAVRLLARRDEGRRTRMQPALVRHASLAILVAGFVYLAQSIGWLHASMTAAVP